MRHHPLLSPCASYIGNALNSLATMICIDATTGLFCHKNAPRSSTQGIDFSGVSHLLHTGWPRHVRALLYKRGNIEGEVLHRLIYLDVVLPSCGRPDPVVVFL